MSERTERWFYSPTGEDGQWYEALDEQGVLDDIELSQDSPEGYEVVKVLTWESYHVASSVKLVKDEPVSTGPRPEVPSFPLTYAEAVNPARLHEGSVTA